MIRKPLLALAMLFVSAPAMAFTLSITYEGWITDVDDDDGFYSTLFGLGGEDDPITGTFLLDVDALNDGDFDFFDSTHVIEGPFNGMIQDIFGDDEFDAGPDFLGALNVGGFLLGGMGGPGGGAVFFELIEVDFDFDAAILELFETGGPVWVMDVDGGGFLGSMFALPEFGEGGAFVEFDIHSLHLEIINVGEPGALALIGLGLIAVAVVRRRRIQ